MIDHITIRVSDFARSAAFYDRVLAPLGYKRGFFHEKTRVAGYTDGGSGGVWIAQGETTGHFHLAIAAKDRATVRSFYEAAIAAGGRDNGEPGLRPQYTPTYYGAFVLDPDGYNIEAVCHEAE